MRFKIDPDTRSPVYEPQHVVRPPPHVGARPSEFVELGVRTAFSGLAIATEVKGESYPEAALGWPGAGTPFNRRRR